MKQTLVLGNIITMDDKRPSARMLGAEKDVRESAEAKAFRELLLKYNMEQ